MKQQQVDNLLDGQSALARKVYKAVPIAEGWTQQEITAQLFKETGSSASGSSVLGALRDLKDIKLIREMSQGIWCRSPVGAKVLGRPQLKATPIPQEDAIHPRKADPLDAMAVLIDIGAELVEFSGVVRDRMQNLASRLDDASLLIAQERETSEEGMKKFRQLQELLKGLAG